MKDISTHVFKVGEMETMRPRTFTIELSDSDIKRLYEKAYQNGISPERLIEGFLGDLLDGTYTHGSDERYLANQYFERCCYDKGLERSFLQWVLFECRLDDINDLLEGLESIERDLLYYEDYPEEAEEFPDLVQSAKYSKDKFEKGLKEIYSEYAAAKNTSGQSYNEGIDAVRCYLRDVHDMIQSGQIEE